MAPTVGCDRMGGAERRCLLATEIVKAQITWWRVLSSGGRVLRVRGEAGGDPLFCALDRVSCEVSVTGSCLDLTVAVMLFYHRRGLAEVKTV